MDPAFRAPVGCRRVAGTGGHAHVRLTGSEGSTESQNTAAVEDVSHLLVRCLRAEGAEYVFGIPGEENIRFVDALNGSGIRYILVRHQQAASFMAEIYGRLTGRAGVCSATLGPGAINLLLGTADAMTNSAPMVALAAQGTFSLSTSRLTTAYAAPWRGRSGQAGQRSVEV